MLDRIIKLLIQLLLIAGALNWGSIAIGMPDLVSAAVGSQVGKVVKMTVGAAGVLATVDLIKMSSKPSEV